MKTERLGWATSWILHTGNKDIRAGVYGRRRMVLAKALFVVLIFDEMTNFFKLPCNCVPLW